TGGQIDKQGAGTLTLNSPSNSFTSASESQLVTIGGSATGGSFTPIFRGVSATVSLPTTNAQQTVSATYSGTGGAAGGSVTLSFNGAAATTPLNFTNEVQLLTISSAAGTTNGTFTPALNGTSASTALNVTN